MFRSLLFLSITVSIVVRVLAVSHRVQAGADDTQKLPIIRSAARLVNVNVVVTDRKGRPVQGLNKDDFQIFDNGHPEKTAFFSTREDKTNGSYRVPSLAPGEYSNDPHRSGIGDQGVTVILFDTVNSAYLSQAYSLRRIRTFLRQLQPEDRVGIYVLNENGLKVVYELSHSAAALLEAMQRYDEAQSGGRERKTTAAAKNSTGLGELDHFLRGKDDHRPLTKCDPQRFPLTVAAFQEIARSTAGFGGRKAVIWVTDDAPVPFPEENALNVARWEFCGMEDYDPDLLLEDPASLRPLPGSPRSRSVEPGNLSSGLRAGNEPALDTAGDRRLSDNDELDILLRLMNQNYIALYPVSAEGLQTVHLFGPRGMDTTAPLIPVPGANVDAVLGAVASVANVDAHQHMERLARRTGGRAYYDRNDLETGIRRALDDAKYGYELAYYPGHDRWNGDWRKIEVKVNRPGLTVLARRGYWAFPDPKLLPPKASKQLLKEIAASPLEATEIPITVKMAPPGSVGSSPVEARVYLSPQNLFTNELGDRWKSDFEVLFFQLSAKNTILDVTTQSVSVELTQEKYSEALKRGINTLERLQLKPGAAFLYVIVHDKTSDAVGSVRIPLAHYSPRATTH
jgi:VWFA-related protein